jgi:metallo-beta-lactamase class B
MKSFIANAGCFFLMMFSVRSSAAEGETKPLKISHLAGNFYVYTTYKMLNGSPFPSNSMYVVTDSGVVMIDTPWDTTQFQPLLDSIYTRHHKKVVLCISTHFHDDRTAGLEFLRSKNVKTYSSALTRQLCISHHEKQAEFVFTKDTTFTIGGLSFQTFYPGPGHTEDNIVVWFPAAKVLYGGCLVKSTQSGSLGNIADADTKHWKPAIKRVKRKFRSAEYVIPGHFGWQEKGNLTHTVRLLRKAD